MKYLHYFKYVIIHKYYVSIECIKHGLFWQAITHDLSKLLLSELIPYTNFFYGNNYSKEKFDYAWLLHQKRNKHHWQWWILPEDNGTNKILDMPLKYRIEMLCDWIGAGKAQGKTSPKNDPFKEVRTWYKTNKNIIKLHPNTEKWIKKEINYE